MLFPRYCDCTPIDNRFMALTTHPLVPIAMGTSSSGTEEGRAFHQTRLALYGRWVCLVSGAFLVFFTSVHVAYGLGLETGTYYHALGTAIGAVIWAAGARLRISVSTMHVLDAIGTFLLCGSFSLMALAYSRSAGAHGLDSSATAFIGILANTYTLISRAIALPATAAHTTAVGAVAMVPLTIVTWLIVAASAASAHTALMAYTDMLAWIVASVGMSAVASRVIFGLRAEVAESRRLGQYTLGEKIGEGGMGAVYRARHAMLRRPTAIKLLPPEKAGAENLLRFEREVQLTASLSHPNTVAIFDYGRTLEGVFYYAMEYLDGINLDRLIAVDGPQPPGRVVRIVMQVSGALAEAHQIGLIHRDIKPANIILCERGGVPDVAKVVDFGLVKRFLPDESAATVATTSAQTLLGTPLYMAPENVAGNGEVDARSDLYSLGAVAYQLLTGTAVFNGTSAVEILAHHLHTPPEPPSRRLGRPLPVDLEALVLRCLAKAPDDRPSSALAIRDRLAHMGLADSWSEDDAARWWLQYRRQQIAGTQPGVSERPAAVRQYPRSKSTP
jgi:eukaryotic-like serine/threonine-protein kinase